MNESDYWSKREGDSAVRIHLHIHLYPIFKHRMNVKEFKSFYS